MDCHRSTPALVVVASCWLVSAGVQAQSSPVTLQWSDDGSCPEDDATLTEARTLAGPQPHGQDLRRFVVSVRTLPSGALRLDLAADGDGRQVRRTVELPDCEQARRASALLIALALNPNAALQMPAAAQPDAGLPSGDPGKAGEAGEAGEAGVAGVAGEAGEAGEQPAQGQQGDNDDPEPPPVAQSAAAPVVQEPQPESDDGRALPHTSVVEVGVRALLMASTLPQPAPGFGLVGAVDWGAGSRVRLQLALDYVPAQDKSLSDADKRISVGLLRATATGCQLWAPVSALALGPCLGLALGRIDGQSKGVEHEGGDADVWLAPEAGGHVGVWSGPIAVRLSAFVSLPLRPPGFFVPPDTDSVFEVPAVGFWAGLGVLLRI